ncbi:MAG: EAL domain-containing protein [Lachnospiraceae bacterium]|nr:EAL domain-containing protein [Lachnospiraceae bacterium]
MDSRVKREAYYSLLERMCDCMSSVKDYSRENLVAILAEICELFHLAKGVTEFYTSPSEEAAGKGEILVDYDNGRGEVIAQQIRYVSDSMAVIKGTVYMAAEDMPLSDEDAARVDLILRNLLSFVSRKRLQKTVERFGFYDEEYYPNRRYFFRHLEKLKARGELRGHTAICLNLKHFTAVNNEIGRARADAVMKNYTELLEMAAGTDNVVCRLGGDNFLMTCNSGLIGSVVDILSGIHVRYGKEDNEKIFISASAGVFVIPEGFTMMHPGMVMERCYTALLMAKRGDSDPILFYNEELMQKKDHSVQVQLHFVKALENEDIKVYYQPKVDVLSGKIVGAEALCRWQRGGGIVPPMEFIPILEQSRDICKLDFYVLDHVCADIRRWLDEGKPVVRVSVNLSRKHLTDSNLLTHILKIIDKHEVPHKYIEVELTETTTDVAFRDLTRVVTGLNCEGVYTSVDDFGVGYSSLNLIREIPWNVLKIDRCFLPLDDEPESSVTSVMFKHVVSMAKAIGLECVTEGVETERQVEILKQNDCHIAQGYYFDKPLPKEEFEARMGRSYYDK